MWQIERRMEIEKQAPQRTNLMIGRTEIPKWSGQSYEVWKNGIERWTLNEREQRIRER